MNKGSQKQASVVNLGNLGNGIVNNREEKLEEKYLKEKIGAYYLKIPYLGIKKASQESCVIS